MTTSQSTQFAWANLATSKVFTESVRRDVRILVNAFALTWLWLENQVQPQAPGAPPPMLGWEYGAFAVFERVWIKNDWHQASLALGSQVMTRRPFSEMVLRAFLDELVLVEVSTESTEDAPLQDLHAIAAAFGVACWWHAQPSGTHKALPLDTQAYEVLAHLPERARIVLDKTVMPSPRIPPSADVLWVVQHLFSLPMHLRIAPSLPRVRPCTTMYHAENDEMGIEKRGSVGVHTSSAYVRAAGSPRLNTCRTSIVHAFGIPENVPPSTPDESGGASVQTAHALQALSNAQAQYVLKQEQVDFAFSCAGAVGGASADCHV